MFIVSGRPCNLLPPEEAHVYSREPDSKNCTPLGVLCDYYTKFNAAR